MIRSLLVNILPCGIKLVFGDLVKTDKVIADRHRN